jgi:hypothetical protein
MTKKPIIIKNISKLNHLKKTTSFPDDLVDKWVNTEIDSFKEHKNITIPSKETEETRLTILIPTYLHRRIKKYCASHSLSMKEKIIQVFIANFPET